MTILGFDFYTANLTCVRPPESTGVMLVHGVSWDLFIDTSYRFSVVLIPELLAAIVKKVSASAAELAKSQSCALLMSPQYKYDKCFYTTRSVCQILQKSLLSSLQGWADTCAVFVRSGIEAVVNQTQPPSSEGTLCEDYEVLYPPVIEKGELLAHLRTSGNVAGGGPIGPRFVSTHSPKAPAG